MLGALLKPYALWSHERWGKKSHSEHQWNTLERLMKQAKTTKFFDDHRLFGVQSIHEYQQAVPLSTYESFHAKYLEEFFPHYQGIITNNPIRFLAESSGTSTGQPKYIPLSDASLLGSRRTANQQVLFLIGNTAQARPFLRSFLAITDYRPLKPLSDAVKAGRITNILSQNLPWYARRLALGPYPAVEEQGLDERLNMMAREAIDSDLGCISAITPWLIHFLDRCLAISKRNTISDIWPNLRIIGHGGVSPRPYQEQLSCLIRGSDIILAEGYAASEGYIAFYDGISGGLRLSQVNGIFYEFIPVCEVETSSPKRLCLWEIETNTPYAIAITTPSGFWSYLLGDIVEFSSIQPPLLRVIGRLSAKLDNFGEHVVEGEIDIAVSRACGEHNAAVRDFHVSSCFVDSTNKIGFYHYFFEFRDAPIDLNAFVDSVDTQLRTLNTGYGYFRQTGVEIITKPKASLALPGTFPRWLLLRGSDILQRKVPKMDGTGKIAQELLELLSG